MKISTENLKEIEENILSIKDKLYKIYSDDELYKVMELTKNKKVFLKCMNDILIPYLVKKVEDSETPIEMVLKLTSHPHSIIQRSILRRKDTTAKTLRLLIDNFKEEKIIPNRHEIINHKQMDEKTLYELTDINNNQILSLVILSNKVSHRILKKLQKSNDEEIRTMAKVRDPETDPKYIKRVIKSEISKASKVQGDSINKYLVDDEALLINDILEAAIKNPKLPSELIDLYKGFSKTTALTLIIPHPNISEKRLDIYYKKGDEDIKLAVEKARHKLTDPSI